MEMIIKKIIMWLTYLSYDDIWYKSISFHFNWIQIMYANSSTPIKWFANIHSDKRGTP